MSGTYNVTGSTSVGNADFSGTVDDVGSTLTVRGVADFHETDLTPTTLHLHGGDLICGELTVTNLEWWYQSTMAGTGTTTILAGGVVDIGGRPTLDGRTLNNYGVASWNGSFDLGLINGAEFNNFGTFDALANYASGIGGDGTFRNYGRFTMNRTGSYAGVVVSVSFNNSGLVEVDSGVLFLSGGGVSSGSFVVADASSLYFSGGHDLNTSSRISGSGRVYLSGTVHGEVSPGFGPGSFAVLTFGANYTQNSTGRLDIEIGGLAAASEHDQLDVIGGVTLAGTINVSLLGVYVADFGDQFVIVNNDGTDAIVGTFAGLSEGETFTVGTSQFEISYVGGDGNDVTLTATNLPPTAEAGGPYTVDEGGSIMLDASGSSDPDQDPSTLTYEWDFDYDGLTFDVDATSITPPFDASSLDGPSSRTIAVRVTDNGNLSDLATSTVDVNNVDPTITLFDVPATGEKGSLVAMSATATDPGGLNDPLTFTWTVTGPEDTFVLAGDSVSFTPQDAGTYDVQLTVDDGDEGWATEAATINVIQRVIVDVKPGSDLNPINLNSVSESQKNKSNGVIPVVILTTGDFDATTVDVDTVTFADAGVSHSAFEDVDGDGDVDLVMHFRLNETNLVDVYRELLAADSSTARQTVSIELTGQTTTGADIFGYDEVDLFMSGKALRDLLDSI